MRVFLKSKLIGWLVVADSVAAIGRISKSDYGVTSQSLRHTCCHKLNDPILVTIDIVCMCLCTWCLFVCLVVSYDYGIGMIGAKQGG
jgi:hypothetical protein